VLASLGGSGSFDSDFRLDATAFSSGNEPAGRRPVLSAIVARAVVVEALPDNLAALDNDAAVAMMQRRLRGLLEAEIHVLVDLHCGKSTVLFEDGGCRM